MCPLGRSESLGILPEAPDYLNSDGKPARAFECRKRYARPMEQRPAPIENGVAGALEPLRGFSRRAGREQDIEFRKDVIDKLAALGSHRLFNVV